MLDTLLEIFDFIQGICYLAYSICASFDDLVNFLLSAIPFSLEFVSGNLGHSLISTLCTLCLGFGLLKFLYPGCGD